MGRRDTGEQQGFPAEVEAYYFAQAAAACVNAFRRRECRGDSTRGTVNRDDYS